MWRALWREICHCAPHERKPELAEGAVWAEEDAKVAQDRAAGPLPDVLCRGPSVLHLAGSFLEAVEAAGLSREASVYEVEPAVILAKGKEQLCPRDSCSGAAYVDTIHGQDHVGQATHMLSYAWFYSIGDIVGALEWFCQDHHLQPERVYVWICSLCINQHRIRERSAAGDVVPFEQFRKEFSDRVMGIGHVLALMAPWERPTYFTRVWCIFELFTAVSMGKDKCNVTILMPPREAGRFCDALMEEATDLNSLWSALTSVKVQNAQSSVARDREAITRLIEQGPGYEAVNQAVAKYLTTWFADTSEGRLSELLAASGCDVEAQARMCAQVGRLLRSVGQYDRAMAVLRRGSQLLSAAGAGDAPTHARLLMDMGVVQKKLGNLDAALAALEQARLLRERAGRLDTDLDARLLNNLGNIKEAREDLDGALANFAEARSVLERRGAMGTRDGAQLLRNMGLVQERLGDAGGALAAFEDARRTLEMAGLLQTPDGARVLNNIGATKRELKDLAGAARVLEEACSIRKRTGTMETAAGAELLHNVALLKQDLGDPDRAMECLKEANLICKRSGTFSRKATGQGASGPQRLSSVRAAHGCPPPRLRPAAG